MVCTVWALASVTDQGEQSTEGRENRNRETSFSTDTQTQSLAVDAFNSMTGDWDSRAELLDHTLFETSS